MRSAKRLAALSLMLLTTACAGVTGIDLPSQNARLLEGPPVTDVVTPFDRALSCLRGRINPQLTFAAGAVLDQTGKEQFTEGGAGKFVTQGAGDIVQSALFKAGTTVVNRRDPRVMVSEIQWKIRDPSKLMPAAFHVTGSINSLDFIPGGGYDVSVAGVGPRYRQHRILVALDLAMTETATGRIVANVPLQKQVTAEEYGIGVGRFFGDTLVSVDAGGQNREALHFALRAMLNLATFELLTQIMDPTTWADCRTHIDAAYGSVETTGTAERAEAVHQALLNGTLDATPTDAPAPGIDTPTPEADVMTGITEGRDHDTSGRANALSQDEEKDHPSEDDDTNGLPALPLERRIQVMQ